MQLVVGDDVLDARIAVPEEDPHAALAVGLNGGQVVVVVEPSRQRIVERDDGLEPSLALERCGSGLAPLVEPRSLLVYREAVVLAPQRAALAPGGPETTGIVGGKSDVRLELRRVGERYDRLPRPAVVAAGEDVVVGLVVGIPRDVNAAVGGGGDGRFPVVGGRLRDLSAADQRWPSWKRAKISD